MGLTNLTPLNPRVGEGQIFKFLTSSQRGKKRAPMISEHVRDTDALSTPTDNRIVSIYHTGVKFTMLPLRAVRGAPKVDPKF